MHKLTKKVLGIVLAGTLSIAMGITAFATPSPEKNAIVTEYTEAVDKNGNNVEIIIENLTEEGKEAAKLLQDKQTLKEIIGDNYVDGMEVIDVREVRAIGNPVFPSKAGKGTITATFDSLSPVAFVVDKNTSASSTESPKTSETPTVAVALVVGIVALASAVMLKKKTALK